MRKDTYLPYTVKGCSGHRIIAIIIINNNNSCAVHTTSATAGRLSRTLRRRAPVIRNRWKSSELAYLWSKSLKAKLYLCVCVYKSYVDVRILCVKYYEVYLVFARLK